MEDMEKPGFNRWIKTRLFINVACLFWDPS